jgi:hypothetical protein
MSLAETHVPSNDGARVLSENRVCESLDGSPQKDATTPLTFPADLPRNF